MIIAPIFVLGPLVAVRSLDGPKSWAIISAGFGLGSILGAAAALRFKPARPLLVGWILLEFDALLLQLGDEIVQPVGLEVNADRP